MLEQWFFVVTNRCHESELSIRSATILPLRFRIFGDFQLCLALIISVGVAYAVLNTAIALYGHIHPQAPGPHRKMIYVGLPIPRLKNSIRFNSHAE
jgi:hypothetical protein